MKLIDNWKQAWKLKSVQVGAVSAFFYALILLSEQFLSVWNLIPQELKNKIPESIGEWVGMFVGVAMVLARLKKQPELHGEEHEKID
jgi:N-acetylmuramoyl-L-alanine amidase